MQKRSGIAWLTGIVLLASVGHAAAEQAKGAIRLDVKAEKEVVVMNADGQPETQRVPAAKVVPDDKVVYTITYVNTGNDAAEHVFITNPVPDHMSYLNGTATGDHAVVTFSVDGGHVFDTPEHLTVKTADGKTRPATSDDYTHIRWTLTKDVASREAGKVSFWAQLE
jgi:uncharacterized repeat protein (TIGR01451 family)